MKATHVVKTGFRTFGEDLTPGTHVRADWWPNRILLEELAWIVPLPAGTGVDLDSPGSASTGGLPTRGGKGPGTGGKGKAGTKPRGEPKSEPVAPPPGPPTGGSPPAVADVSARAGTEPPRDPVTDEALAVAVGPEAPEGAATTGVQGAATTAVEAPAPAATVAQEPPEGAPPVPPAPAPSKATGKKAKATKASKTSGSARKRGAKK